MLVKLEVKSARVKGISFHPKRSWVLASLHNGQIQLWDYQLNHCIDKFEGHDGPVRGIDFHSQQPLFVSGGDDYRIKLWNYQQRRCIFHLNGHVDYVRSVFFHKTYPWVLSASDDQTCRIWNWQSRQSICVLTGHNHYVMCAQFHPTEHLVVSASLDQTCRVWDIKGLINRYSNAPKPQQSSSGYGNTTSIPGGSPAGTVELFGEACVVVKHVLEGHDRGVNWASFHPTMPLIVSSADDRNVKLWRMTDSKAWEISTMRGHYNNVSCCLFYPRNSLVISNSEDRSVRVWDLNRRTCIHTIRRDSDRFWVLATHPTSNLIAAGHDSGLILFKLDRERPAWASHGNLIYYVKDRHLRKADLLSGKDVSIMRFRGPPTGTELGGGESRPNYCQLLYNPAEEAVIVTTRSSIGSANKIDHYEMYKVPARQETEPTETPSSGDYRKGTCKNAVWIGRNRFAVLVDQAQLVVKNLKNEVIKKIQFAFQCDNISYGGTGMLLLHEQDHVSLFDVHKKRRLVKVKTTFSETKMCIWSKDMKHVALIGRKGLMLCGKNLEILATFSEVMRIKSGAWDESEKGDGLFIYNTNNHLKYALTSGDCGTIRTLDVPIYIVKANQSKMICFDREVIVHIFTVDPTDYMFKLALHRRDYDHVIQVVKSSKLVGQSSIAYLREKGYPEIALHFVKDPQTKFALALECCNVEVALESAKTMDSPPYWDKLAEMSLLVGNHEVVELCYQRTRNYSKLAFLYTVTGNMEKLKKMQRIVGILGKDKSCQYLVTLLTGDVQERVKMLEKSEQDTLAYYTAVTHGLIGEGEEGQKFREGLVEKGKMTWKEIEIVDESVRRAEVKKLMGEQAPLFIMEDNWPLLNVARGAFELVNLAAPVEPSQVHDVQPTGAWIDVDEDIAAFDEVLEDDDAEGILKGVSVEDEGKGDWEAGDDIEIPQDLTLPPETDSSAGFFVVPTKGNSVPSQWASSTQLVADHVMAGSFDSAARLLEEQLGVVNLAPFRDLFLSMFVKSRVVYTPLPNMPPMSVYPVITGKDKKGYPVTAGVMDLNDLISSKLKDAYDLVTLGKFQEAVEKYKELLLSIPLTVVESKHEVTKAQELIFLCREYILGLQMELYRKNLPKESLEDQVRSCELAAYLTHSNMDAVHLILALRTAMNLNYKLKNFKSTASFAKRLLELGPKPEMAQQTRKILQLCEKSGGGGPGLVKDENPLKGYDEHNPFRVCAMSYEPIYRGNPETGCGFCGAKYKPEFDGTVCAVCGVVRIGSRGSGLKICRFR